MDLKLRPFKLRLITDQFKSRQPSTMNRYLLQCRKLINWCNDVKVQFVLPMEPAGLAAYLSQLFRRNGSPNTLSMAYAALVWLHDTVNVTASYNPLKTGVCENVVEAAKRSTTQQKNRKLPVSTDMVKETVAKYGKVDANLKDLRISVIVLLGFAGFFRFKELANIRTSHIEFAQDHIPDSKTDVYREGNKAIIVRSGRSLVQSIWSFGKCLLQRWTLIHPTC